MNQSGSPGPASILSTHSTQRRTEKDDRLNAQPFSSPVSDAKPPFARATIGVRATVRQKYARDAKAEWTKL